jgi:hypothetical protein
LDLISGEIEVDEQTYDKAVLLNGFSVQIRYPDKSVYLTTEELEFSIQAAQEFRAFAISTIGLIENTASN